MPQDAITPSNSTRRTCNLFGSPSKYYPGLTLLDFGNQMGTGRSNVARGRSPLKEVIPQRLCEILNESGLDHHLATL
jgi:hypothetical protein